MKLLYPIRDALELLSLGRTKFYDEVRAGRLIIVHAGGKSLVPQSSLDAYVAARIAEATALPAAPSRRTENDKAAA